MYHRAERSVAERQTALTTTDPDPLRRPEGVENINERLGQREQMERVVSAQDVDGATATIAKPSVAEAQNS